MRIGFGCISELFSARFTHLRDAIRLRGKVADCPLWSSEWVREHRTLSVTKEVISFSWKSKTSRGENDQELPLP